MKLCQACGQLLAEDVALCPACGSQVAEGRKAIDEYRILEVLHEGYASILCRAARQDQAEPVMLRIFTPRAGVNERIAGRLKKELEELKKLPEDYFVRHFEIRRSSDGLWYRVSEWIEAERWSDLLAAGFFRDHQAAFRLFARIANILEGLHRIGHHIPHLILHDIIAFKGPGGDLEVKIDYKLSRFLDPRLDRPGPMLKKLLENHPDIVNGRPLDHRSDIWSLGKVFAELLSADLDAAATAEEIETLGLPREAEVLLKLMLADDPDLRPHSMALVAETLYRIPETAILSAEERQLKETPLAAIRGLRRRVGLLAVSLVTLAALGLCAWWYASIRQRDSETRLLELANRYAGSVAFMLVDYRLADDDATYYHNRTEGTAFLADAEGYLLTNRHVACPWLEDRGLQAAVAALQRRGRTVRLEHRAFLWFEGQRAFKRLPQISGGEDPADRYFLDEAWSTTGERRLAVMGVGKVPGRASEQARAPLKNDFAVLKVYPVPEHLQPLPLDSYSDPLQTPKLLPVIALGFPLGSQTQETSVNVSVTTGHVRRAFENFLQVDTSLYRGNSGGPVIDVNGRVIGIASSVAVDWAVAPLPVATPLSDLGMVLPIAGAAAFLQEIKAGAVKWDGNPDPAVHTKIERIKALAGQRRWTEARELAETELKLSRHPLLVMAAGTMNFCEKRLPAAAVFFDQAISMDPENGLALFMRYLADRLDGRPPSPALRQSLAALDWRSPQEFYGFMARTWERQIEGTCAPAGAGTALEYSWLSYLSGLKLAKGDRGREARDCFAEALGAVNNDEWVYYLALSAAAAQLQQELAAVADSATRNLLQAELDALDRITVDRQSTFQEVTKRLEALNAGLAQPGIEIDERRELLKQLLEVAGQDDSVLLELAFVDATAGAWERSLNSLKVLLQRPGRESHARLSAGLLEGELLRQLQREKEATSALAQFAERTADRWYRRAARCLLGEEAPDSFAASAVVHPAYLLTARTALGLWAEGGKDPQGAVEHYREALASYLDEMPEYGFALGRIQRLRKPQP